MCASLEKRSKTVVLKTFGWSFGISAAALVTALAYGGPQALVLTLILGVLEVSLSFDNAVMNATVLERMNAFWQKIFLTVGIVIAVFGMRIALPLLIVGVTAHLGPMEAISLAMAKGPASDPNSYQSLLAAAHPQIAAFGGMFLLMIFLDFVLEEREIVWLNKVENMLAKVGKKLDQLSVIVALTALMLSATFLAEDSGKVMVAGVMGLLVYLAVNALDSLLESDEEDQESSGSIVKAAGKAAFVLFLYIEVLDASFSFDGVIGAFAITSDPILIALGLGLIGAMFVRSLTVYLVRQGTLSDYVYLEHGAHWAIGALATCLFLSMGMHVPEVVTGLTGVGFIGAAFVSSVMRNKRTAKTETRTTPIAA
jgi:hypothetical protein